MTGRFVVFEGGEGSGKSTQAARLAERWEALLTREPGGTELGAKLRGLLLDPATGSMDRRAEALLMAADRAHHVATVIRPALEAGRDVVCDRYLFSSVAYQGYGRGLHPDEVRQLSEWATGGLLPDLVVLLDVSAEVAAARLDRELDRFESAGDAFHERVRAGFRTMADLERERWEIVDADASLDEVSAAVDAAVARRLGPT